MIFHLGCLLSQLKSPTTHKTSDMQGIHLKMTDIVILVPLYLPLPRPKQLWCKLKVCSSFDIILSFDLPDLLRWFCWTLTCSCFHKNIFYIQN